MKNVKFTFNKGKEAGIIEGSFADKFPATIQNCDFLNNTSESSLISFNGPNFAFENCNYYGNEGRVISTKETTIKFRNISVLYHKCNQTNLEGCLGIIGKIIIYKINLNLKLKYKYFNFFFNSIVDRSNFTAYNIRVNTVRSNYMTDFFRVKNAKFDIDTLSFTNVVSTGQTGFVRGTNSEVITSNTHLKGIGNAIYQFDSYSLVYIFKSSFMDVVNQITEYAVIQCDRCTRFNMSYVILKVIIIKIEKNLINFINNLI